MGWIFGLMIIVKGATASAKYVPVDAVIDLREATNLGFVQSAGKIADAVAK